MLSLLLDRRLDQHSDPPQMRATPPPSPSAITTLLATYQSTPSLFHQSLSMPPRSVSRFLTHMDLLYWHLPLVPGQQHPATLSMTAPHTGCSPMVTALLLYMPVAHDQSVWSMLSQSHATLYYGNTHMRSLCEHNKQKKKTLLS